MENLLISSRSVTGSTNWQAGDSGDSQTKIHGNYMILRNSDCSIIQHDLAPAEENFICRQYLYFQAQTGKRWKHDLLTAYPVLTDVTFCYPLWSSLSLISIISVCISVACIIKPEMTFFVWSPLSRLLEYPYGTPWPSLLKIIRQRKL